MGSVTGFETATTATLEIIRANLLGGLDRVAASLEDGTFHTVGPKGEAPPVESGRTTLALLEHVESELAARATR